MSLRKNCIVCKGNPANVVDHDCPVLPHSTWEEIEKEFDEKIKVIVTPLWEEDLKKAGILELFYNRVLEPFRDSAKDFFRLKFTSQREEMVRAVLEMKEESRGGPSWTQDGQRMLERFDKLLLILNKK